MKVGDISSIVAATCHELETLKTKIGEDISHTGEEGIKDIIDHLQKDSNQLAREMTQNREIASIDPALASNLNSIKKLIHAIQHSPAYSVALGAHQAQLVLVFRKIENSISKFEQRVQRVDTDPLR